MAILNDDYTKFAKFEDFKDLYKEFLVSSRKENKDSHDELRCHKLAARVDQAFNSYTDNDKIEAVRYLVDNDLAPKEWLALQALFNGTFMKIT